MTDYQLLQRAMHRNPGPKAFGLVAMGSAAFAVLFTYGPALLSLL